LSYEGQLLISGNDGFLYKDNTFKKRFSFLALPAFVWVLFPLLRVRGGEGSYEILAE
jgi:hypothetical protein